ncbi:MAG TPA: FtsX-like permease family protein [Ktedonobacteraceae bacterium]|nr:FtsX-like permease family protein [Ktedonobacteraceae bacterium]
MGFSLPGGALTRKSIADVTRRRLRTILVVLGIAVGVLGLTAINITSSSLSESISFSANRASAPDFSFNVQAVDASLAPALAAVPNVKTVQFDTEYITRWHTSTTPVSIAIIAYADFHNVKINTFELTSGHLPGPGEVVMEASDRQLQNFAPGDDVTIETASGPQRLHVVGMARTLGQPGAGFLSFATAYMSADALGHITGISNANHIDVQLRNTHQVNATARALANVLRAHHVVIFSAFTPGSNTVQTASDAVFAITRVLAIIALILTSFLIINTVTTLIAEQIKIIGTMKALGGTRQKVMRGYLLSVGIYGIAGTALGIGLGIFAGYEFLSYLANLFTLDLGAFQVTLSTLLISIAVGISVPLLAALLPLWLGTRITAREAMTSYGMSNGKHSPSRSRLAQRMAWIPQTTRLGMRSMFRKRTRAILTLLALTISGIAFLSVSATSASYTAGLGQLTDTYHQDALVATQPQPYDQLKAQILSVPNVARVERFDDLFVKTQHGQIDLNGVETDTHMYRYRLLAGRWFRGDEPNVLLISDTAAAKLHLKVGDTMTFSNATDSATWTIIGEVLDHNNTLSGGVGITTIDDLHAFEKLPANLASGFMIQARNHSPQAVERMANALDATLTRSGATPNIQTQQQIIARNQSQFGIVTAILYAVSVIIGLVGLLGLFNTLTISVLERRREIGILRSMGATSRGVARVFWTEGISLAVVAWIAALVVGIPAAYAFVNFIGSVLLPLPFTFAPVTLAIMLTFILLIATLASFAPALSAARVRVSDILRYD